MDSHRSSLHFPCVGVPLRYLFAAADLLLWKDWKRSATFLRHRLRALGALRDSRASPCVTILADGCMILITAVFLWAQFCHFTKR